MNDELKPCPFCGGKAEYRKSCDVPPCIKVYHPCKSDSHNPYHIIIETKWCKTVEEAVELWNRRAE